MAGDFKMEFELKGTRYVLNRAAAAMLLASLDGFGDACSDGCKRMRDDLRKALDGVEAVTPANPFDGEEAEVAEEHTLVVNIDKGTLNAQRSTLNAQVVKDVAKENAEACGDCRVPRCRFCDQPGGRSGGRKDAGGKIVERYYVCQTPNCIAAKMATPQPAKLFAGGEG